ncbi:MAG: hypothetical protein E7637_07425 [Ruminococcaceae bacterium]|nr:hypothetical protein [Oscillospiraceae bacterium]
MLKIKKREKAEASGPKASQLSSSQKNRLKDFFREYWHLGLCMLIPVVLVWLVYYFARDIHPFGDGSVLVLDLNSQYVTFFEALRNFVHGDADLLYSFNRALGGEFLGMYAYYLASPFSFIVCLFPKTRMLEGLLTMFLIKTAICGATFGYYMHRTMKKRNRCAIVLFSICYALSAYAIVQQNNTMWIDAVMWLPLITLGIESLIKEGKFKMYTIVLALTVFSNYYIGFMVCIYCFLYFFAFYLGNGEDNLNNPLREKLHFLKSLGRMAFYSIIALGIAAVILLSAYYSLNFGKTSFSDPNWEWKTKFDLLELSYKFLPGSYDTLRHGGYPFVYCGVLTLLLVPLYFLSKRYTTRQKIAMGALILVFIASFSFTVTDLVWHLFQKPNWMYYRYSFMLSFILCVLACRAFTDIKEMPLKPIFGAAGVIVLACVLLQKVEGLEYIKTGDFKTVWLTILALFVYLSILALMKKARLPQILSIVMVAVVSLEVVVNGWLCFKAMHKDVVFTNYSSYNNYMKKNYPIVEMVQESDTSFYRMEKTFWRTNNDNMSFHMNGLSGSTSTLNQETIQFLNKMGYAAQSHHSRYRGGNPVNDSLLGLKYIISDKAIYSDFYHIYKQDPETGYTAYRNPYALSIAFGVSDDVLDFPLGFVPKEETEDNAEETEKEEEEKKPNADGIGKAIDTLLGKLNEILGIEEIIADGDYLDEYDSPFERLNAMVTAMLGEEETVRIFVPIKVGDPTMYNTKKVTLQDKTHVGYYTKDTSKAGYVTYKLTVPEEAEIFFYMPSDYRRESNLALIEGSGEDKQVTWLGDFQTHVTNNIISLGKQDAGDKLSLQMQLKGTNLFPKISEDFFYYIDMAVFEDVMSRLAEDQLEITEYTGHSFTGTLTTSRENELVLTTIPYDKGWKVTVNGKEVETVKALGSLVAFHIDGAAGETYTIEMVYSPNTLWIGLAISGACLLLLIVLIIFRKRMMRIKYLRALVSVPEPPATDLSEDDGNDPPPPENPTPPDTPESTLSEADGDAPTASE